MQTDYLKQKKLLLVDDAPELLSLLVSVFTREGYENLVTAATVQGALEIARREKPDLAVLDVMLPDGSGFSLLKTLRGEGFDFPVLFLTARGEDEDRLQGLGAGADDYLVKPFLPQELILRVRAVLYRTYKNESPLVHLAACDVDFERALVLRGGQELPLTAKEHALLFALYKNAGRIVTIDTLCEAAWGDNPFGYENSLMAHVRRIREKIEANPSKPASLLTVKGLGYKLLLKE